MVVVRQIFLLVVGIACTACSHEEPHAAKNQDSLCQVQTVTRNAKISVNGVYVFGDFQHGVAVIDEHCPSKMARVYIAKSPQKDSFSEQQLAFRHALFFSPKVKSGMFKIDGILVVDQSQGKMRVDEVTRFYEISGAEKDRIFALARTKQE